LAADKSGSAGTGAEPRPTPSASRTPSASASPTRAAAAFPADPMLIRVDLGDDRNDIYQTVPGSGVRTRVVSGADDILPKWSTDRRKVVFVRRTQGAGLPGVGETLGAKQSQIWVVNADGTNAQLVTDRTVGGRVTFSPDDSKLAFLGEVDGIRQLFVITLGEREPVQWTSSPDAVDDPAWSPTGDVIAISSIRPGQKKRIYLVPADRPGAPWRPVTSGKNIAADPGWSPDGSRIAYTCRTPQYKTDIWVVNRDGTGDRAVTRGAPEDMDASFSPDGSWLSFSRGPGANPVIHIVRVNGSGLHRLDVGGGRTGHASWS
ncbi:MAG TPA: hypothetical protein VES42_07740, partial [Pilimelia sp.]|nr:hypothetical protein [Pilimelia sp.]